MGLFSLVLALSLFVNDKIRIIEYNGTSVQTTYEVPDQFYGKYTGRKSGYLQLKADGTGTYVYDVFGFATQECTPAPIEVEWGFLHDEEKHEVVYFDREYGRSYPILLKSTSQTRFQGCRKKVMLDFIMVYKNGHMGVSSSDDWIKN